MVVSLSDNPLGNWNQFTTLQYQKLEEKMPTKMYLRVLLSKAFRWRPSEFEDNECLFRMQHILLNELNCSTVAKNLEPQIISARIYHAMRKNRHLWNAIIIDHNCSQLHGRDLDLCEANYYGKTPHYWEQGVGLVSIFKDFLESDINEEIDHCYKEEKGNLITYMTKR